MVLVWFCTHKIHILLYRAFCDESGIVTWVTRTLKSLRITALDYYVNAMEVVIGQLCNRTAGAVFQQRVGILHC
jgi:hypothetical protein